MRKKKAIIKTNLDKAPTKKDSKTNTLAVHINAKLLYISYRHASFCPDQTFSSEYPLC